MALIDSLATVLAHLEGNGTTDINGRSNNALNVELGDIGYGTITAAGGNKITVFPDATTGFATGTAHLQSALASAGTGTGPYANVTTLGQFLQVWNGGNAHDAATAATAIGLSPSTPISQVQQQLLGGGAPATAMAIAMGSGIDDNSGSGDGSGLFTLVDSGSSGSDDTAIVIAVGAGLLLLWLLLS